MKTLSPEQKVRLDKIAGQDIDYHRRQFATPYRSTIALGRFMQAVLGNISGEALDVACGAGANIAYLSQLFPHLGWTGVDMAGDVLFESGRPLLAQQGLDVKLVAGDFYDLDQVRDGKRFEVVTFIQTLMILPEYDRVLDQLIAATRKWLIITSPLTDFEVDARIAVTDYTWPPDLQGPHYYSVFSVGRLERECYQRGCRTFVSEGFDIDVDLPVPPERGLGTYTRRVADGTRLQFTGPIHLPWKFVAAAL